MAGKNYKRVVLKLSGEALSGTGEEGINFGRVRALAVDIAALGKAKKQVVIIIGAGNFWRYRDNKESGIDRVTSDHMGMHATVLNAVAMAKALIGLGAPARVFAPWFLPQLANLYVRDEAAQAIAAGEIVLCAGGTGSPFFTTDTAAALRGLELQCDAYLKATKVDGVYDRDPIKHKGAKKYARLSYDDVLAKELGVMDAAAVALCREGAMPVIVFDMGKKGNLMKAATGDTVGTLIS